MKEEEGEKIFTRRKEPDIFNGGDVLTRKQKTFADAILAGKKPIDAAAVAYGESQSRKSLGATSSMNMRVARIQKYLLSHGYGAAERIIELSKDAKSETVRLNANQDILDRSGVIINKNPTVIPIQINFGEDREKYA